MPVSGQDGDHAALNRVALGTQTVSVWKDARDLGARAATIAVALANGKAVEGAVKWAEGEKKVPMDAIFLKAVPVTQANLDVVIAAGHISKEAACRGGGQGHRPGGVQVGTGRASSAGGLPAGVLSTPHLD